MGTSYRGDRPRDAFALVQAIIGYDSAGVAVIIGNCNPRAVAIYLARIVAYQIVRDAGKAGIPPGDHLDAVRNQCLALPGGDR